MIQKFIFGVMFYNHEKYVLECLESIKYQIVTYGQNKDFKLVITDDNSNDRTKNIVQNWITINKQLFSEINLKFNDQNIGVVANYHYILSSISQCEDFKVLAGDDLYSSQNLFAKYENLNKNEIKSFYKIMLSDGVIKYDEVALYSYYWNMNHKYNKNKMLRIFRRGGYLHTPSTIHSKELYDQAQCQNFNSKFRLFEDDPTWYMMLKHVNPIDVHFEEDEIVLYRIHENAISNGTNVSPFILEKDLLQDFYKKDSCGFERIYWWFKNKKISGMLKIVDFSRWIDFFCRSYIRFRLTHNKGYINFENNLKHKIEDEQRYYDSILKSVMLEGENCASN